MNEVVWLHEYRRFAFLLRRNTYDSLVLLQLEDGTWGQTWVENDDYDLWEERAIDYESDDGG